RCPGTFGLDNLAGILVKVEGLALAVRLDAHVDRHDRRITEVGRAEGVGVARAHALDVVLPQRPGVFAWLLGLEAVTTLALVGSRRRGLALQLLLDHREAGMGVGLELDRRGMAADH